MNTQDNILVGVGTMGSNHALMDRAIREAELDNVTLVVANVMPQTLYEDRQDALNSIGELRAEGISYTIDVARDAARTYAAGAIADRLGDSDVEYVAVGAVGNIGENLLAIAEDYECGTIMLGEGRSWWRRHTGWDDRKLSRSFGGRVILVPETATAEAASDATTIDA